MYKKYIYVTQGHIDNGVAGSETHCPVSLAVVDSIDEDKLIYFHVAVDCHTPNFFKERLGQKPNEPMRYSIKIEKLSVEDCAIAHGAGVEPRPKDTEFIMLDQEVTDWVKLFDSCEWHDVIACNDDDSKRLEPITIEVYDEDGITHGRMFDERYNKK